MDLVVLKKKISTFRSEGGKLRNVDDDVLYELLCAWEGWAGPLRAFYKELGVDHRKMASLIGRAKKLKREGHFPSEGFREIKIEPTSAPEILNTGHCRGAELVWKDGQVIRFQKVDMLLDFLTKVDKREHLAA